MVVVVAPATTPAMCDGRCRWPLTSAAVATNCLSSASDGSVSAQTKKSTTSAASVNPVVRRQFQSCHPGCRSSLPRSPSEATRESRHGGRAVAVRGEGRGVRDGAEASMGGVGS